MRTTSHGYIANPDLRARLQAFTPDEPGVVFPFTARLAREQGWTREHARRVVREYLRFVYLAATAGHPVTPSKSVDEAWHLHLTYTRSYWDELCGRVLMRPLHHEPTRGGAEEDAKFGDWYARTLDSYRAAFAEEPPPDVWPRPRACDCPGADPSAGARPGAWRVTKPVRLIGLVVAGLVAGGGMGTARASRVQAAGFTGGGVLLGLLLVVIPFAVVAAITHAEERRREERNDPGGRKRREDGGGSAGADVGCGSDGGGDGHHGGCGGHSGCGHGCGSGCGHGCGSACGSGCGGGE